MTIKEPVVLKAPKVDMPDDQYRKLATKLGIKPSPIPSDILLLRTLTDLSIAVYDYNAVRRYLIEKRPMAHYVTWVPVSSSKTIVSTGLRKKYGGVPNLYDRAKHGHIAINATYNKPIPYPVLLTIDQISSKLKGLAFTPSFYVSDYVEHQKKPEPRRRFDPFLAVGTSDSDALFVIERWDEPGFREEPYSSKKKSVKTAGK